MTKIPLKQVRLAKVWDFSDPITEMLISMYWDQFVSGRIRTYGLRQIKTQGSRRRDLIKTPIDYLIMWIGPPDIQNISTVVAVRRSDLTIGGRLENDSGSSGDDLDDLTIAEDDWDRLCASARAWCREWINMVFGRRDDAPPELATFALPTQIEEASPAPSDAQPSEEDVEDQLAEFIFQHQPDQGAPTPYNTLLRLAVSRFPVNFKKADFATAYRRVYETSRGRPKIAGWPLRQPYKDRFLERQKK